MGFLDHEVFEVGQHMFTLIWPTAQKGGHVREHWVFIQIEADHVGHERVDRLVIGNAGANGIADRDPARPKDRDQARHPQHRVGAKDEWVEEVVIDAPVNHIDALRPPCGLGKHTPFRHKEVRALNELHAHLLGQIGMLEVGAVKDTRREDDHRGVVHPGRGHRAQVFKQQVWVMLDWRNRMLGEELREEPHHHPTVLDHVRHAGGHPQVVLEHEELALPSPHDVHPTDVGPDLVRQPNACNLGAVLRVLVDELGRHDAFLNDAPTLAVNVL